MLIRRPEPPIVSLALQGGGAHGAFTWGVLDALLEDGRLRFEALSGTSAGAMNAVAFAQGWMEGRHDGARATLAAFWQAVGRSAPFDWAFTGGTEAEGQFALGPAAKLLMQWTQYFSPQQLNPLDLNPLRDVVTATFDFERLRRACPFKLFVAATQVSTGKLKLFREHELTADHLLASACLPMMHRAVEIDGQAYWDGGYTANPAVFPLFYECETRDMLLVLLSPLEHPGLPQGAAEIRQRSLELGFASHVLREMRMFLMARDFALKSAWPLGRFGRLERRAVEARFHMVESHDLPDLQRTDTKLLTHLPFLEQLRDAGRERAQAWLERHADGVGKRSTIDLRALFG